MSERRPFRIKLRTKLLLFASVIAVVPLLTAGQSLIRIAQDELKSSVNVELVATAKQVADEFDDAFDETWLAPLRMIRNAIDNPQLGVREKIAILQQGIAEIPDLVALQVTVRGSAVPLLISQDNFAERLALASLVPRDVLVTPGDPFAYVEEAGGRAAVVRVDHVDETDDWIATLALPLPGGISGQEAVLTARVDLRRLAHFLSEHPFSWTGRITVVDSAGRTVLEPRVVERGDNPMVAQAVGLMGRSSRAISVGPYETPEGEAMLATYSFPDAFPWAIIAEKEESVAYYTVRQMIESLAWWLGLGLFAAGAGAFVFAARMSRPIVAMAETVTKVGEGDFRARVEAVRSRDEIGDLARHINRMIVSIGERFELAKFVSGGTLEAIRRADNQSVRLGGERRRVAVLFSDIRGYTAFAEARDPAVVVDVLNLLFRHQTDIVVRNNGDVDKFVGDQVMAVFQGESMAADAVACAIDIQAELDRVAAERTDLDLKVGIGIALGEAVVGAMGSHNRMDFTVLGDVVNLAARLCSAAAPGETLVSEAVADEARARPEFAFDALAPVSLKGKAAPVVVFAARPASLLQHPEGDGRTLVT